MNPFIRLFLPLLSWCQLSTRDGLGTRLGEQPRPLPAGAGEADVGCERWQDREQLAWWEDGEGLREEVPSTLSLDTKSSQVEMKPQAPCSQSRRL